ncbi:MAG: hypothetical protein ACQSGP_09025 [Frankia sp.]
MTILATSSAPSTLTAAGPARAAAPGGLTPMSSRAPVTAVRVSGVDGVWVLRAWEAPGGRRYELRVADDIGTAGLAAAMTMLPDGLRYVRAGMVADDLLATGRPELTLEFSRPLVP